MPNILANIAKMDSVTTGTGTLTLGSAVTGYLSFATAGVTNGQVVTYAIEDYDGSGNIVAREVGAGTYSSTGPTLSRDTVYSSTNAGAKINCSGLQYVFVSLAKEDLATYGVLSAANTWSANNTFSANAGFGIAAAANRLTVKSTASNLNNTHWLAQDNGDLATLFADSSDNAWLRLWDGAGTEQFRFRAGGDTFLNATSGNVGIGNNAPISALHVSGTNVVVTSKATSGYGGFYAQGATGSAAYYFFGINGTESARIQSDASNVIIFANGSSSTERVRIDSSGNVGVGATAPEARLHVRSDVAGESGIFIQNNNAGGYAALRIGNSDRGTNGDHLVYGSGLLGIRSKTGAPITFEPAATERVRITTTGDVGIGISAPTLNSAGTFIHIHNSTATRAAALHLTNAESGSGATNGLIVGKWSDSASYFFDYSANPLIFGTSSAERMRLDASGNVVIGTTAAAARLHVSGGNIQIGDSTDATSRAVRFQNSTTNWNIVQSGSAFTINNNAVDRVIIDSSGRIGVGSSPGQSLDVLRTVAGGLSEIRCFNGSTVDNTTASVLVATGTANAYGLFRVVESSTLSARYLFLTAGTGINGGTFFDLGSVFWRSQDTATEYMRLGTDGNLLIGGTNSLARLTLNSTTASKIVHFQSSVPGTPADVDVQEIITVSASAAVSGLTFGGSDARLMTLTVTPANEVTWRANKLAIMATDYSSMYTGGLERLRLTNGGVLNISNDAGPQSTDTLAVGFRGAPHNDQTGTTYTFARTDAGRAVMFKGTSNATYTIPLSTTTDFPIGTMIIVDNSHFGSGSVTVTVEGATGVGIRSAQGALEATTGRAFRKQLSRGSVVTLRKLDNRSATQSVTSITRSTTTATMTTPANHGYSVGDFIEVAGASQSQYNGTQRVNTVPSNTTLTYSMTSDPGGSASGTLTVRKADLWNATGNYSNV